MVQKSEEYIESLVAHATHHRAVYHPYLQSLKNGLFSDMNFAFKDFARQYFHYNINFSKFLRGILRQLGDSHDTGMLKENLKEEQGRISPSDLSLLEKRGIKPEWVVGIPHTELFQRFHDKMIPKQALSLEKPPDEALHWSYEFNILCSRQGVACALGALGLGTELVVRPIYEQILEGIKKYTDCTLEERVFFEVHAILDENHADVLKTQLLELQNDANHREQMAFGMTQALELRSQFFDQLHFRAKNHDSV